MKCIICEKDILKDQKYFMVAIEKPYLNIRLHRECYDTISDNLVKNVHKLVEMWYNNNVGVNNVGKSNKTKRKSRKITKNS